MKERARLVAWLLLLAVVLALWLLKPWTSHWIPSVMDSIMRRATVADRVEQYEPAVRARLEPDFSEAGVAFPPARVALAVFKEERRLELYAAGDGGWHFVRAYPVLGASGGPGPKLREGDNQVPEGVYRVESLNPNSRFHLSLRLDYPNAFDREQAAREGRENLGGDIMIHGSTASVGCVAVGDEAAEDLFVLAALAGAENVEVIVAPTDFRRASLPDPAPGPSWVKDLYRRIDAELKSLPLESKQI